MTDVQAIVRGDEVLVWLTPAIQRRATILAIDEVYAGQAVVRLNTTRAIRVVSVDDLVEHYPASSSPAGSTTSAS